MSVDVEFQAIAEGKDATRSRREDLIRQMCQWFSHDGGMAYILQKYILNTQFLCPGHHQEGQVKLLLEELGLIFEAIPVCSEIVPQMIPKARVGNKIMTIDTYVKETADVLGNLYNSLVKIMPAVIKQDPELIKKYIEVISKGGCSQQHVAISSFLQSVQNGHDVPVLLQSLENVMVHVYLKHGRRALYRTLMSATETSVIGKGCDDSSYAYNADSDSAFYASDTSSLLEQNVESGGGPRTVTDHMLPKPIPKEVQHLCQYTQILLKDDHVLKISIMNHLATTLTKTNWEGKLEIFAAITLPLLETGLAHHQNNHFKEDAPKLGSDANDTPDLLLWSLECTEFLLQTSCIMGYLRRQPHITELMRSLIGLATMSTNGDLMTMAGRCLKDLAFNEVQRFEQLDEATAASDYNEMDIVSFHSDDEEGSMVGWLV